MAEPAVAASESLRIDKLLWYLRFARNRTAAQSVAQSGHIRLNGRRVDHAHVLVRPGDVVTLMRGNTAIAARILALPQRRGPPSEARGLYSVVEEDAPPARSIATQ